MGNTPNIRFKGFTDDWEQRKLGEICQRVIRKNKNNESDLPLTIASQYGLIDQRDFFNKVVAAKDMSNYYLLRKGEFAYNKSYSNGFEYGSIKRLNAYEQGCLSTLYICFEITSDEVDSDYLECFFDTLKWYGDLSMICAEGARNHGLLNVDIKAFFADINVSTPTNLKEQRKIATYLNNLDHLITLHQRKCDETKKLKKFMLQKMFPKKDAKKPEIRFAGFTDDWEQRKLGEVSDVRDGTHDSPKYQSIGHPFVTSKNVKNGYITYDDIQYISDEDFAEINKRSKVDINDILMGMIGTIGNMALIRTEPDFAIKNVALIKDTKQINYLYLYHLLQSPFIEKQLTSGMDGGTQKFVSLGNVRNLNVIYPSDIEQDKIGCYFEKLDHLITLHQRKCDKLKKFKKYMLQNMFPQKG